MSKNSTIKRIGDIALRRVAYNDVQAEIVKYYPNSYYGRESEFRVSKDDPNFYDHPEISFCLIHKDCFKNPESCYVVAYITNEEEPDVLSVSLRPWELEDKDARDFKELLKWAMKHPLRNDDNYDEEDYNE